MARRFLYTVVGLLVLLTSACATANFNDPSSKPIPLSSEAVFPDEPKLRTQQTQTPSEHCGPYTPVDFENQSGWVSTAGERGLCDLECGGQTLTMLYKTSMTPMWRAFAVDPAPEGGSPWVLEYEDTSGNGHAWDEWAWAWKHEAGVAMPICTE